MPLFTLTRGSFALNTAQDALTFISHATKSLRVYIADAHGLGTSSAVGELLIARSSGGVTPGGAVTARPTDGVSTPGFTTATTWGTQPALGHELWRLGVNANGGQDRYPGMFGAEFKVPAGGSMLSIRPSIGSHNIALNVLVEED